MGEIPIVCDECQKDFLITDESIKRRDLHDDVKQVYFVCPHCGKEYPVVKINNESEAIQAKIDYYADRIANTKDPDKKLVLAEKMNKWRAEKKQVIEELNA